MGSGCTGRCFCALLRLRGSRGSMRLEESDAAVCPSACDLRFDDEAGRFRGSFGAGFAVLLAAVVVEVTEAARAGLSAGCSGDCGCGVGAEECTAGLWLTFCTTPVLRTVLLSFGGADAGAGAVGVGVAAAAGFAFAGVAGGLRDAAADAACFVTAAFGGAWAAAVAAQGCETVDGSDFVFPFVDAVLAAPPDRIRFGEGGLFTRALFFDRSSISTLRGGRTGAVALSAPARSFPSQHPICLLSLRCVCVWGRLLSPFPFPSLFAVSHRRVGFPFYKARGGAVRGWVAETKAAWRGVPHPATRCASPNLWLRGHALRC
eukprot:Rhum_TRINITY_DN14516_c19_g1::Rhum_TRINITY_DN14516_c19_g1_i1::g.94636::m.94636